jgi:hypothetical protein
MTERGTPMPEHELDRLLGAWLGEGASGAPDRIAENAMLEIATVPQEHGVLRTIQTSFEGAPLAWAAVFLALAIGVGVLLGPRLVGEPTPSPSETPAPSESLSPSPSQSVDPNSHQSVTPVGTIEWTRVESDTRIFPWVEANGEVLGEEVDPDFNAVGWWTTTDGISWEPAAPGAEDFWPSALDAGDEVISVISPDGCGSMMGPSSSREVYVKLCEDGPGDAAVHRLEGDTWVEVPIPAPHPPEIPGVRATSRALIYPAALSGDDWVVPSVHILQVAWEDIYGTSEWESPFGGETSEMGPWPFWRAQSQVTEIWRPGRQTLAASLNVALTGSQVQFTDAETGQLVNALPATVPGWTPEAVLAGYRGWGLEEVTLIVSRDGVVSEVRSPWTAGEDWAGAGQNTAALGRYFMASFAFGEDYATEAVHLWESDDGVTWSAAALPPWGGVPEWTELAGSENQLIMTAHSPDSVWVTSDGRIWTEVVIDPALAGSPTRTAFGWIMNAFDAAAISGDGVTWEAIDLPELPAEPSVSYLNGLFFYGPEDAGNGRWAYWVGTLED